MSIDNCSPDFAEAEAMGLMLEALKQIEVNAPPAPVILPLGRDEGRNSEGGGRRAEGGTDRLPPVDVQASNPQSPIPNPSVSLSSVERFTFPELPKPCEQPPAMESPKVVWPECHDTETACAAAEMSDGILRQLSLDRPTVVAFTSPDDGDGKTSLLIALAPQLARRIAGSILVVDANIRTPSLTARLNMPVGETATRPALIYPTNLPRLNVLPASAGRLHRGGGWGRHFYLPRADRNVYPTDQAGSFIEDLRKGWALVLLDTASLVHPEAASMARCCDGVYLVVRLGHTARRAVAEAARVIRGSGGRLLGCVVVK